MRQTMTTEGFLETATAMASANGAQANATSFDSTSDLVDHFKLDVRVEADCTIESLRTHRGPRSRRKQRVEKRWRRIRELGSGTFGQVWLEEDGENDMRAVKSVRKNQHVAIDLPQRAASHGKVVQSSHCPSDLG